MAKGFDLVAPFYDSCVSLVFGNKIANFQCDALHLLSGCGSLAIIGGGTGLLLEKAFKLNLAEHYYYVERSDKMRAMTSNRIGITSKEIEFLNNLSDMADSADCFIFPFVLDCYSEREVEEILIEMKQKLKPSGEILVVDFDATTTNTFKRKSLITILYLFFKVFTRMSPWRLPRIKSVFESQGFTEISHSTKLQGWLFAALYKSSEDYSKTVKHN